MFTDVTFGCRDPARLARFDDAMLGTLGLQRCDTSGEAIADGWPSWGVCEDGRQREVALWLRPTFDGGRLSVGNGAMVELQAASWDEVRRFHTTALAPVGAFEGAPGLRLRYNAEANGRNRPNPSNDDHQARRTWMLTGRCLCGAAGWTLKDRPESATACSCTACRRYGALWAYGWEGEDITVTGPTTAFVRGDSLSFNFCPTCGNVSHWRGLRTDAEGRRRVAVNLRLSEPGPVADVPIRHFDGLDAWDDLPDDGRCVKDLWF